ncbi:hypothetical protein IWW37_003697 [Coemansia sp. RSA 2050]|nr:hypothetical protein IWW37_003697 [Coemansia sp. RSA 2050]KAJ2736700.1 hypothetical protein IW152_000669 [Coemansia sp. BCRC 34962]
MSQHYAPVGPVGVENSGEIGIETPLDQAVLESNHGGRMNSATTKSTLAHIAASRQQHLGDADDNSDSEAEEEEEAAEFDSLFEFTDDVQEKPASHHTAVRHSNNRVWQAISYVNWPKVLRFTATYLALPFVTGVMAGMGEIFANEFMYRWGWKGARPVAVAGRNGRVFPVVEKAGSAANIFNEPID